MVHKRKSTGIVPAGIFIVIILTAVFYVVPMRSTIADLKTQVDGKKQEAEKLDEEYKELKKIETDLPSDISLIKNLIPRDLKEKQLIDLMEEFASSNNIVYNSLSFSPGSGEVGTVSPVTISTSFEGTYPDLLSFLETIEKTKSRKFRVRAINVSLTEVKPEGETKEKPKEQTGPKIPQKYLDKPLKTNFTLQLEAYYQGVIQ